MPCLSGVLLQMSGFPPRSFGGDWTPFYGWTHVISDFAIGSAFLAIPLLLVIAAAKRRDFDMPRIWWLFLAFILACGVTRLIDALLFWHPIYQAGAVAKVIAAAISWTAVVVLVYKGPRILRLPRIFEMNRRLEREVQQRREAERRLVEQAEILQLALAAGEVGTWRWDLKTNLDSRDAGLNRILGLEPEPSTQPVEDFIERVHPADRDIAQRALKRTQQDGGDYAVEVRVVRPDRTTRWIRDRGRIVRDENGEPAIITGAVVDITEARRAEEHRARLAAIVESSPDAIISQSLDGTILSWNTGAERTFGFSAEEAVGQSIEMIIPQDRRGESQQYRSLIQHGGNVSNDETVRCHKDGTLIYVWLAISPIVDPQGNLIGISTIDRDITERKRYDQRLEQLNSDLQTKNAEMEQFVYTVSHDLKSPLVTMLGFTGLIREDLGDNVPEGVIDSMSRIEGAARRMSQLIDDLLELSRVGLVKRESEPVNVTALVRELQEDLSADLRKAGAELIVEGDLRPIDADPYRLRQVLQNLLTNAIKYGCAAEHPQIRLGTQQRDDALLLYVRDNGPGVRPEHQERIFRLFEQVDPGQGGTGVGLALVEKIMRAHGGRAWVDVTPGGGATFWLAFPYLHHSPTGTRPPAATT